MRRLIAVFSALSMLGLAVGCHHTAGVCDCEVRIPGCPPCCPQLTAPPTIIKPAETVKPAAPPAVEGVTYIESPQF